MKVGKLSQTAWNRAVMKQLYKKQEQNLLKISAAESCSAYAVDDEQVLIKSAASTSGDAKKLGNYSLAAAINQLASRGAKPIDVQIFILISERIGEQKVAGMVQEMEEMCTMMNIAISNVQVEVNPAVTRQLCVWRQWDLLKRGCLEISRISSRNKTLSCAVLWD